MKRSDAIAHLRFAGYHGDRKAFTRIYVENRVSYAAANEAYAVGVRARATGVPCTCFECSRANTGAAS
jgi:hypothetical protein